MANLFRFFMPDDRPAFMQMVDNEVQPTINGYTLQVNVGERRASIIISKKGGSKSMVKTVVKALEGFEKLYDEVCEMKANHEAEKEMAIQNAIAEVEARYAEKSAKIDELFAQVSVTEEYEVADEEPVDVAVEGDVEETVSNEGTIAF